MPIVMHFATFLKLLTLNTGDKIRDLERYAKPGGFDFYRPSRDGVVQHCALGRSRDDVIKDIEASATTNAIERNKEIFERVATWIADHCGITTMPNRGVWRSPKRTFSVHIEPEISFQSKDTQHVIAVYPRKDAYQSRPSRGRIGLTSQKLFWL